jgi:hypothetical protein
LTNEPLSDLLIQISLVIIGAALGYFIPRFFGWKGEYRNEKIVHITKLIEECYGPLRYLLADLHLELSKSKKEGKKLVRISVSANLIAEADRIYSKYYHELDGKERHNLEQLLDQKYIMDGKYLIEQPVFPHIEKSFELINQKHDDLSNELKNYRELKKGVKKTVLFDLKFGTI